MSRTRPMFNAILRVFTVALAFGGSRASDCQDGWTTFQGSCYLFGHSLLTFNEAEEQCKGHGGYLAHIETPVENTFIKSYLGDLKDAKHWIGLTDDAVEGIWKWHGTDTITTFYNWGSGQPEQGKLANCVAIWASFGYNWVDEPCSNRFQPLCEKRIETEHIVG